MIDHIGTVLLKIESDKSFQKYLEHRVYSLTFQNIFPFRNNKGK